MSEHRKFVTTTPENSETPLDSIRSWVTPNRHFFVRNHFNVPTVDASTWRLRIAGCVESALALSWDDLSAFPERSVFATVECAGNGRSFLHEKVAGVQWGAGAIGHAEWTGIPLFMVLEKARLRPSTVEILFQGADSGTESDHPETMHFQRSLTLKKALDPHTLLVTRMNGEPLEPIHGAPLRLFVPGWYGVASVKWLERIEALDRPFLGYYQMHKYTVQRPTSAGVKTVTIQNMAVKSEIIRPRPGESLGRGANRIFGTAWAGEDAVARVEVSVDGGRTWRAADLIGPSAPYSWTLWEYLWEVATPGEYSLLARAVSRSGLTQPMEHDPMNGGYLIHFSRPTSVSVADSFRTPARLADWETMVYDMNAFAEENTRLPLDINLDFAEGAGI